MDLLAELLTEAKKALVFGNAGDKKNLQQGGSKFIFFNRFSEDIIFFSFFCFFDFFFCCCCFLKLKMYILIHIRLCGRVSDKFFFTRSISGNETIFLWPDDFNFSRYVSWLFTFPTSIGFEHLVNGTINGEIEPRRLWLFALTHSAKGLNYFLR